MKMTKELFDGLKEWGFCEVGSRVRDKATGVVLNVGSQNDAGFLALVDEKTGEAPHAFEALDEIDHERFAFESARSSNVFRRSTRTARFAPSTPPPGVSRCGARGRQSSGTPDYATRVTGESRTVDSRGPFNRLTGRLPTSTRLSSSRASK